jgi:WD40 repeat protein
MKLWHSVPVLLLSLFASLSPAAAQDAVDTGWTVDEMCIGEATPAAEGWTFPGAILLTGRYGIHAVSADVPTPYVVAFINQVELVGTGVLSPDGRWYAVLIGKQENSVTASLATQRIEAIRVYSTEQTREIYTIPWDHFDSVVGFSGAWDRLLWFGNQLLIYPLDDGENPILQLIDPFEGTFKAWENEAFYIAYFADVFIPSEDLKHAIYDVIEDERSKFAVLNRETVQILGHTNAFTSFLWKPKSDGFIVEVRDTKSDTLDATLSLFDPNGEQQEIIVHFPEGEHLRSIYGPQNKNVVWSPDGRYLAFITTTFSYPTVISLYIADMQEKLVINTCIEPGDGLAWSPDGKQLALMDFYDYERHRPVMVLDVEAWALHTVAYHDGNVIGWRE